jgi:putative transcriptional regulator
MLNIKFEFVGGPNDGKVVQGKLGEPCDAERHFLFSNRGRVGQRFAVASDYAVDALMGEGKDAEHNLQRHYYVVTDRQEKAGEVWVRAEYVSEKVGAPPQHHDQEQLRQPKNLDGHLLVATPRIDDPWFSQSVVLVLEQSDEETFGVILNHPTKGTVSQLWDKVSDVPCDSQLPVHVGGPDEGPVVVLHTDERSADAPILPGIFLSVDKQKVERIIQHEEIPQRLSLGAASWSNEQLQAELSEGDWLVLQATKRLVFAEPENQWREAIREFGHRFLRSIGVKNIPDDPSVN